jgi:hypothetical protein
MRYFEVSDWNPEPPPAGLTRNIVEILGHRRHTALVIVADAFPADSRREPFGGAHPRRREPRRPSRRTLDRETEQFRNFVRTAPSPDGAGGRRLKLRDGARSAGLPQRRYMGQACPTDMQCDAPTNARQRRRSALSS